MIEALRFASAALLIALLSSCSAKTAPNVRDSNSNWLATCDITADCEGDGSCICGLCTATCGDDDDCVSAGPGASCVRLGEASGQVACAAIIESTTESVCLGECSDDDDCLDGSSCVEGACWASPSSVIDRRDSGSEPPLPAPDADVEPMPPLEASIPADIWALDASVDFEEPAPRPAPSTELQGAQVGSLIGTWDEVQGTHQFWGSPIKMTLTQDTAAGRVSGTIEFSCDPNCSAPTGPFPAPSDPNDVYPPGIEAIEHDNMRVNVVPYFPYRMLDPRLEDGRLAFWFTSSDVWTQWCALQTPYPVTVDGMPRYACMPDARPYNQLISELADSGEPIEGKGLLCASDLSVCSCTASSCTPDYHSAVRALDFDLVNQDTLQGLYITDGEAYPVTLTRRAVP
jgi:hypothetical protein